MSLIRIPPSEGLNSADISNRILSLLEGALVQTWKCVELSLLVPRLVRSLKDDGGLAMIYALMGIFIYVALRFQRRFAVGAIAALVHDVLITLGIFSITHFDFDLTVLAAILAVIGYSLNDTIVVFRSRP